MLMRDRYEKRHPDDDQILAFIRAGAKTADEQERAKLHTQVFDILQNSPEGYATKANSRIRSILDGPFLQASIGLESLYRDAVVALIRNVEAEQYRHDAALSTYLCGIAIIVARNELRKTKRYLQKIALENNFSEHAGYIKSPETDHRLDQITQAIANLEDPEAAEILRLFYCDERTDRQIAEELGCDGNDLDKEAGRIKKKRQRAMQRLREQFGRKM